MNKYIARDLIKGSAGDILAMNPKEKILVEFDDGVIETTPRRTLYCHFLWELHRRYPNTPVLKRHHMGMRHVTANTHSDIMNEIYWDLYETYGGEMDYSAVWKAIFEITNNIFNDYNEIADRHVASMSAFDIYGIVAHPKVLEITKNIKPNQKSIDAAYDAFSDLIKHDPDFKHNEIAHAVRIGALPMKQAHQCFVALGYVTEQDSMIFPNPITVSYARGVRNLHDSLIESRKATKALIYAKYYLGDCEYFNRKLQLSASVVRYVVKGDCGSTHTMAWKLKANELESMVGINYVENGVVKSIKKSDNHLVGKTLQIRTPFGCIHHDRQNKCEVCCGNLSLTTPEGTSIGHMAAIAIGELISQLVLSTKHHEGSSVVDIIEFDETASNYLTNGAESNAIRFSPKLKGKKVKMVISSSEAKGMPSISTFKDFESIQLDMITELTGVMLIVEDGENEPDVVNVPVSMGSRLGSLSKNMLYYIQEFSNAVLSIDSNGDYTIDLSGWDFGLTAFTLPMRHTNTLDYMQRVAGFILSGDTSGKKNRGPCLSSRFLRDKPVAALKEMMALVNSKLKVNATNLFIVAYSMAAKNPAMGDYNLPLGGESFIFVKYEDLMSYRSLGTKLAYQTQAEAFRRPESYVIMDRPAGLLDEMTLG